MLKPRDIEEIWECHLDGCSLRFIQECKVPEGTTLYAIRKVLSSPPPESISHDDRVTGSCFYLFSVDAYGTLPQNISQFVIVLAPLKVTATPYNKFNRTLGRYIQDKYGAELTNFSPVMIESDVVSGLVNKGYLTFTMQKCGTMEIGFNKENPLAAKLAGII